MTSLTSSNEQALVTNRRDVLVSSVCCKPIVEFEMNFQSLLLFLGPVVPELNFISILQSLTAVEVQLVSHT